VRFDRGKDEIFAHLAADQLEREFPCVTAELGFKPKGKTLIEIFNRSGSTDGHGWFSARMVGLPYIGTVAACAGKMIAMQSPNESPQKFNWARVLRHEFVHVINLQQTDFAIPHWFTEALAVRSEDQPRPKEWNQLLASRLADDTLFTLDSINLGFIRPASNLDWQLAYCQAELYADYMVERAGAESIQKMLAAYRDRMETPAAIKRVFGVDLATFEQGYREFLETTAAPYMKATTTIPQSFEGLVAAQMARPRNVELTARLALEYLRRKNVDEARRLSGEATAIDPKHQLAAYVAARLLLLEKKSGDAIALLTAALHREKPHANLLALLASLKAKAGAKDEAAELYELGAKHQEENSQWLLLLEKLYAGPGDEERLDDVRLRRAAIDAEARAPRIALAIRALGAKDFAKAIDWSREALAIDSLDGEAHRLLADAQLGLDNQAAARQHYEFALRCDPNDAASRKALESITRPEDSP
jgi:Tfp pilus assembly protein PilF